jgi:SAM-dependent methyltransferase
LSESPVPSPESRSLERLRTTWAALGTEDPLWAILSSPDKRGRRWDTDEFFAAGEAEIAGVAAIAASLGRPRNHGRALDFGCGVGRLSRALASRYAEVVGVDISPSMVEHARQLNVHLANVRFVENAVADLSFLESGSVDLVYSTITLHHIPAPLQLAYIREFLRVLSADGVAIFQIASGYSRDWRGWTYRMLPNAVLAPLRRYVHDIDVAAEMHTLSEDDVAEVAASAGRRILHALDVGSAGRGFRGRMLCIG